MKTLRIKSKLYLIPMITVFIAIIVIYYGNYKDTKEILESEYKSKLDLVEQSIYNETKYTGIISNIAENEITNKMEGYSKLLVDKYKKDPKVLAWDLEALKSEFENMDIYIVDKDLTIVASSVKEEVGLDFKLYKDFSKLLKKRIMGDKFESDTINFSIRESEMKKFSYMPTPDNKYLIELSVNIHEAYPEVKDLNIVYLSEQLVGKYPFVEDIRVYKYNTQKKESYELDTIRKNTREHESLKTGRDKFVKIALETNQAQEQIIVDENNTSHRLKYIPYTTYYDDKSLTWWQSYVIEILYNDEIMVQAMSDQKTIFFRSIFIISILYFGFVYMVVNLIQKNRERANKDHLTKLPNRKRFEEIMTNEMYEASKKNSKIAVLFFDLNKFKEINDKYGHSFGDKVLQEVANKIDSEIRKGDMVSRIGGDEFIGMISNLNSKREILEIAERMSSIFEENLLVNSIEINVKSSLGISVYPDHGETIEELLSKADTAMYESKQNKKKYIIYE